MCNMLLKDWLVMCEAVCFYLVVTFRCLRNVWVFYFYFLCLATTSIASLPKVGHWVGGVCNPLGAASHPPPPLLLPTVQ